MSRRRVGRRRLYCRRDAGMTSSLTARTAATIRVATFARPATGTPPACATRTSWSHHHPSTLWACGAQGFPGLHGFRVHVKALFTNALPLSSDQHSGGAGEWKSELQNCKTPCDVAGCAHLGLFVPTAVGPGRNEAFIPRRLALSTRLRTPGAPGHGSRYGLVPAVSRAAWFAVSLCGLLSGPPGALGSPKKQEKSGKQIGPP